MLWERLAGLFLYSHFSRIIRPQKLVSGENWREFAEKTSSQEGTTQGDGYVTMIPYRILRQACLVL
jgi:hypothetical protein